MRRGCLMLGMALTSVGCFSLPTNGAGVTERHVGCELTMQANSFAGICGEMVLVNSGSQSMTGWTVNFEIPTGTHLTNAWGAQFAVDGARVTVRPNSNQTVLAPGDRLSFGYCTGGPATHVDLAAGLCANAVAPTPHHTLSLQSGSDWQADDACAAQAVVTEGGGLTLTSAGGCAAVQAHQSLPAGRLDLDLSAAVDEGASTRLVLAAESWTLAVLLDAAAPNMLRLQVQGERATAEMPVKLVGSIGDEHHIAVRWADGTLVLAVDDAVVWSQAQTRADSTVNLRLEVRSSGGATSHFGGIVYTPAT